MGGYDYVKRAEDALKRQRAKDVSPDENLKKAIQRIEKVTNELN